MDGETIADLRGKTQGVSEDWIKQTTVIVGRIGVASSHECEKFFEDHFSKISSHRFWSSFSKLLNN